MRLALAGDTMLGRAVGARLGEALPPPSLFAPEVVEALSAADLRIVNLECCISERGKPGRGRVFHFRAPPAGADALAELGVDCVTLANNHALDFGPDALLDTLEHLRAVGIRFGGAGEDAGAARASVPLDAGDETLRLVAVCDHPAQDAAGPGRPGVAYVDLEGGETPSWLVDEVRAGPEPILLAPHWGPNMVAGPLPHVRRAAEAFLDAGASLIAGHSAHVFHGVDGRVLFDLGDFVDDYRVDPVLRNDLGLLWFVDLDAGRPVRIEALPLKLDYCHTRIAEGEDRRWIVRRFLDACSAFGTEAREEGDRLAIDLY